MALTLAERANLADDSQFIRKVRQALIRHAVYQRGRTPDGENFSSLQQLGISVLQNPEGESRRFAHGVASDPMIESKSPQDSTISSVIEVIFPAYTSFIESPPAPEEEEPESSE